MTICYRQLIGTNDYKSGSVFSWQNKEQGVGIVDTVHISMEVSGPSDTRTSHTSSVPLPSKRVEHNTYHTYDPHTPIPHYRSPAPYHRGRGKNVRGKGKRNRDRSSHYESYSHDSPPRRRHMSHNDYHQYQPYPQRTPIHTQNRFSPLRGDQPRNFHNSQYTYRDRENGYPERSPFNCNQRLPRPPQTEGFHREMENTQRNAEQNAAPEGGGVPGKRKRT